jgi:hypothetical protein
MATRFLYQPQDGQTVCGVFALPQRGQVLRGGAPNFHALARWLRVFDLDFFFFGTATMGLQRSGSTIRFSAPCVHGEAGTGYRAGSGELLALLVGPAIESEFVECRPAVIGDRVVARTWFEIAVIAARGADPCAVRSTQRTDR